MIPYVRLQRSFVKVKHCRYRFFVVFLCLSLFFLLSFLALSFLFSIKLPVVQEAHPIGGTDESDGRARTHALDYRSLIYIYMHSRALRKTQSAGRTSPSSESLPKLRHGSATGEIEIHSFRFSLPSLSLPPSLSPFLSLFLHFSAARGPVPFLRFSRPDSRCLYPGAITSDL